MSAISISLGLLIALFGDSGALPDAQAATDRRVRITKDVPVLRVDHISIKGVLLGVWQVSDSGECDPDSRRNRRAGCHHSQASLDRSDNQKHEIKGMSDASRRKSSWLVVGFSERPTSI